MNDLISQIERKGVAKSIDDGEVIIKVSGTGLVLNIHRDALREIIVELIRKGEQRDWIPVTPETLPDDGQQVLIYSALTKKVGVSDVISELVKYPNGYFTVTHWMPLPALPEQESLK